jgi:hypothetical protein
MEGQTEQPEQIWRALCQQAVIGNDLDKPIQLSKEINRLSPKNNRLGLPVVDAASVVQEAPCMRDGVRNGKTKPVRNRRAFHCIIARSSRIGRAECF